MRLFPNTSEDSSFLLRQQCPAKRSLCWRIVAVTRGIFPYGSALERWSIQDLFKAALNILVYEPSIFFSRADVSVQEIERYTITDSTAALKKFLLSWSGRLDFQILFMPFRAAQAFPSRILTSCSVEAIKLPRYLKTFSRSITSPFSDLIPLAAFWFRQMNFVFVALTKRPITLARFSTLRRAA